MAASEIKKGSRVKATRRNGEEVKGFVTAVRKTLRGAFYTVETKIDGETYSIDFRAAALKKF